MNIQSNTSFWIYMWNIQNNTSFRIYICNIQNNTSFSIYMCNIQSNTSFSIYMCNIQNNTSFWIYMCNIQSNTSFWIYTRIWSIYIYIYMSLSWYDIPKLVVPIRISLIEGYCHQGSYWTKDSYWLSWSHHFESFTVATMTWLTVIWNNCVTNDHGYVPLIVNTPRSFPHSWLVTFL